MKTTKYKSNFCKCFILLESNTGWLPRGLNNMSKAEVSP